MSKQSYLNIPRLIAAAEVTDADAIHPGYGFLQKMQTLPKSVLHPASHLLALVLTQLPSMGDKALAKETMKKAGVPVVPGSEGIISDITNAKKIAQEMGLPVIIKATAGGGGRGMRIVRSSEDLENAYLTASHEAETAFGNAAVYIEKYIEEPRHVEIQIMGDQYRNCCPFWRTRLQHSAQAPKIGGRVPSPALTPELREAMGRAAVKGAKSVKYVGAGTVEFLLDKDKKFLFYGNEHTHSS